MSSSNKTNETKETNESQSEESKIKELIINKIIPPLTNIILNYKGEQDKFINLLSADIVNFFDRQIIDHRYFTNRDIERFYGLNLDFYDPYGKLKTKCENRNGLQLVNLTIDLTSRGCEMPKAQKYYFYIGLWRVKPNPEEMNHTDQKSMKFCDDDLRNLVKTGMNYLLDCKLCKDCDKIHFNPSERCIKCSIVNILKS